jgi:hypothetical protein
MIAMGKYSAGIPGRRAKRQNVWKLCGFTLVEVLVAAAITLLLAGVLLTLATNVLTTCDRAAGTLDTESQAEIILEQIAADLEATVTRVDPQAWFAATVQADQSGAGDAGMTDEDWPATAKPGGAVSLQLAPDSGLLEDARFGQAGVWLRFLTTQPDANDRATSRSAPRGVAYQIVRRRAGAGHAYQLFRSQVRPGGTSSTFSVGYNLFAAAYTTPSGTAQNPGNVRRPNSQFLLGNNVIDFGVKIFVRALDGSLVSVFPANNTAAQSLVATTDPAATPLGYAGNPVVRAFPAAAEVMIRILTPGGATLIANLEAGLTLPPAGVLFSDYWWRIAGTNSRVFVRHVEFKAQPL